MYTKIVEIFPEIFVSFNLVPEFLKFSVDHRSNGSRFHETCLRISVLLLSFPRFQTLCVELKAPMVALR